MELELDSIQKRRHDHAIKLAIAFLEGRCHPMLSKLLVVDSEGFITIRQARTKTGRKRFDVAAASLYNDVVEDQRQRE